MESKKGKCSHENWTKEMGQIKAVEDIMGAQVPLCNRYKHFRNYKVSFYIGGSKSFNVDGGCPVILRIVFAPLKLNNGLM